MLCRWHNRVVAYWIKFLLLDRSQVISCSWHAWTCKSSCFRMLCQHVSIEVLRPLQLCMVQLCLLQQVNHLLIDSLLNVAKLATDPFDLVNQDFTVVKNFLIQKLSFLSKIVLKRLNVFKLLCQLVDLRLFFNPI